MPTVDGATGARYHTDQLPGDQPGLDPALLAPPDQFGKDTFLKLLVAQLKYQNPLDPMDGTQFMAQTAQFTTVEKLTELTDKLGESLANDRLATATAMLGRDVTYERPDGVTVTERVTSIKFNLTGPLLVLADGSEVGLGQISQVSAPPASAAAGPDPAATTPPIEESPADETDEHTPATDGDPDDSHDPTPEP